MSTKLWAHQRFRLLLFVLCALVMIAMFGSRLYEVHLDDYTKRLDILDHWTDKGTLAELDVPFESYDDDVNEDYSYEDDSEDAGNDNGQFEDPAPYDEHEYYDDAANYREISSISTWDRKYIPIYYNNANVVNPNIIPHPTEYFMWIIVARHKQKDVETDFEEQLVCTAMFYEGSLLCTNNFKALPVAPSIRGNCDGESTELSSRFGPRNARVFHGPDAPYVVYGSQSQHGCMGVWIQDARALIEAFRFKRFTGPQLFTEATEIRRSGPSRAEEKNFFLFWDDQGTTYVHHDLWPQRVFAELDYDGSVGEDLAPLAASLDQVCFAKYMPHAALELGSLEQATNSLSVTLCKREDADCLPDDSNTFVMHIFHIKSVSDGHVVYEPYVLLFGRIAPFAVHAISQKPLWIHGRKTLSSPDSPDGQPESVYITSMNWKSHTQTYHGFIDDKVFLGFGIEDSAPGALDILAGDLLQDLGIC